LVGGVVGGLDCEGSGDCVGGVACGIGWFVGGVVGGIYCEGGRDCGEGVLVGIVGWLEVWWEGYIGMVEKIVAKV
jgi:hypothetical protein